MSFITLPFADDFNLITRDVRKHRKLMTRLHELTSSMGLKLKPGKCRSLSVKAGKSVELVFSIGEAQIASILHDRCHKFLGGIYTFDFASTSIVAVIRDKLSGQLKNIDNLLVRSEYKARIYADYLLGSLRFILSVHDLNRSQLNDLESLTHSYLKRWLGLPRGASWALVHDSHGMNVKSVTHLYEESRALSLSNIRFFSDRRVRHALDLKEEREGKWRRKFSSAVFTKGLIQEVVPPTSVQPVSTIDSAMNDSRNSWSSLELNDSVPLSPLPLPPPPPPPLPHVVRPSVGQLKGRIQAGVQARVSDFWKEKVGRYVMQGDYISLIMEEKGCVSWKSFVWDIPQGVLKFALNAGLNTMPTFDNLKRWGKRVCDRCPFCGNIQTLAHVLSNCSVSLDQGRLTWRHDSVLSTIIHVLRSSLIPDSVFYSDVLGHQAPHGGTIPPYILVTSLRPDIVVIKEDVREIIIFELTCPWDSNIERSHTYKEEKYAPLVADLSRNYRVFCFSFEVSVRGQVTKANKERLKAFVFRCCSDPKRNFKSLLENCSKASLLSSYSLFSARREPSWSSPAPLIIK